MTGFCQTPCDQNCPGVAQDLDAARTFPHNRGSRGERMSVVAVRHRGVLVFSVGSFKAKNHRQVLADNQPASYPLTCPACRAAMGPMDSGPDACLGYVPGVRNACCGHGRPCGAYVQLTNGVTLRHGEAIEWFRARGYPLEGSACPEPQP